APSLAEVCLLSLHDALPILARSRRGSATTGSRSGSARPDGGRPGACEGVDPAAFGDAGGRRVPAAHRVAPAAGGVRLRAHALRRGRQPVRDPWGPRRANVAVAGAYRRGAAGTA